MGSPRTITTEDELRAIIGSPAEVVVSKISDRLNGLTRQFIERSPFVCVATKMPGGGIDVSPRGDPPAFVRILDDRTLLIPDRPGNKIADTLRNLLADPSIGLLFLIPGVGDSFRVNGRGVITDDQELLAPSEVEGVGPAARDRRLDRGGLHPVLEGAHPLRALEPRAAHRALGSAELRRDPALAERPGVRRGGVRPRARRALRARRRPVLALRRGLAGEQGRDRRVLLGDPRIASG